MGDSALREDALNDNVWLVRMYADAWSVTREPLFGRIVWRTRKKNRFV